MIINRLNPLIISQKNDYVIPDDFSPICDTMTLENKKTLPDYSRLKRAAEKMLTDQTATVPSQNNESAYSAQALTPLAVKTINIIYSGDIHGAISPTPERNGSTVGGICQLNREIANLKTKHGPHSILLDSGDWGQGTLESNISQGQGMTELLNVIGYDAVEIGNHEFDWGMDNLRKILEISKFPVLGANILKEDLTNPEGIQPYIIKEIDGVKVGIIGLITNLVSKGADSKNTEGLIFEDVIVNARRNVDEMKKKGADLIIALSHQNDQNDINLAETVPGIDIIVGGHSHIATKEPMEQKNTLIVKAGTQCRYVGCLNVNYNEKPEKAYYMSDIASSDSINPPEALYYPPTLPGNMSMPFYLVSPEPERQNIFSYNNDMIPVIPNSDTIQEGSQSEIEKTALPIIEKAKEKKTEIIGTVDFDLTHDRLKVEESTMGDFFTDVIRFTTKSDISFQTTSGIRDQLFKGRITYGDLYRVFPFDNSTVCIDLSSNQIKSILEHSAKQEKNYLQMSGVKVDIDLRKPEGNRVSNIRIQGKPLEENRAYSVAIDSILANGSFGYEEFAKGTNIRHSGLQRDTLLTYIKEKSHFSEIPEKGRINYIRA